MYRVDEIQNLGMNRPSLDPPYRRYEGKEILSKTTFFRPVWAAQSSEAEFTFADTG